MSVVIPLQRNPPANTANEQEVKALDEHENRVQIGARIKVLREHRGLRRYQLAEMVGKSGAYIGKVEIGEKGFSVTTLEALAAALGVTPDIILGKKKLEPHYLKGCRMATLQQYATAIGATIAFHFGEEVLDVDDLAV